MKQLKTRLKEKQEPSSQSLAGKQWKAFVANRVRKITEIGNEIGIEWKYCPSSENLADLGSRGANIEKMVEKKWFEGPDWLPNEEEWPEQPVLKSSTRNLEEQRPIKEAILFTNETESDEWDKLLERQSYWRTLRTTSWCLRFIKNCLAKKRKEKVTRGPLTTEEIMSARDHWVVREQRYIIEMKETPGWKLIRDEKTVQSLPFQNTGVDFAGPLKCRGSTSKEEIKVYVIIFTCAVMRAVHLEVTRSQTAEEFQRKLNAFITRKMRPEVIVSDNASVFKTTAEWIKLIRKSEKLQDHLATLGITWRFNLSKSPWWGAMYERLIKDLKKTLYKTLGKTHLQFEQLEAVIMDIERHLNNRPLTYVESESGEEQVLTPNKIMWGKDSHTFEDVEVDEERVTKMYKRLKNAKEHVWSR
eukprot:gene1699-biopygen10278